MTLRYKPPRAPLHQCEVWRDSSPPAFTALHPHGSHPAWHFADVEGQTHGPYFTREDAEKMRLMLAASHACEGGIPLHCLKCGEATVCPRDGVCCYCGTIHQLPAYLR